MKKPDELTENQDTTQKPPLSIGLILRAFRELGPYKWLVFLGNLLCFGAVAANMAMIREVKLLVDRADLLTTDILTALAPLAMYCLINRICGGTQWLTTLYACNRAVAGLRKRFFAHLQVLSSDFYDRHKSGWLVARNTGDMHTISHFLNYSLMMVVIFVTSIGFAFMELGKITPLLLLPCLVMMPVMVMLTRHFKTRMSDAQRASRAQNSRVVANLSETARGIREVHAFNRETRNSEVFTDLTRQHYELELDVARLHGVFMPSVDLIGVIALLLVVLFGSLLLEWGVVTRSGQPLSAGELAATLLYMHAILWPMRILVELYNMALQASAAAERLFEVIDRAPSVKDRADAQGCNQLTGAVHFDRVFFRYGEEHPWVLQDLSFHIEPGQTVALVGTTGAGKTTIAALIGRYYDVTSGAVRIDEIDVRDLRQVDLRSRMGVVLQQSFLFTGSVLENITFARPQITREEVERLAGELGTHEAIAALPEGYDTEIREGGESLSLGQRQLIALTRALVSDPDILILDEPTSSLDVYSERIVQASLERLTTGRTTLVIAHRLSTIRNADRILVIDHGGIVEAGPHDELVEAQGVYADLVARSRQEEKDFISG